MRSFSSRDHAFEILRRRLERLDAPLPEPTTLEKAAVIGLLDDAVGHVSPRILLIERARELSRHAGQLAFPGGKPEPDDRDLLDTALREAEEEIGLDRDAVEVLGRLHPVPTPTGFMIVPFVGRLLDGWEPRLTSTEVVGILRPELDELVRPDVYRFAGMVSWQGRKYGMHEFAIHDPPLWGATARMVWDLLARLGTRLGPGEDEG